MPHSSPWPIVSSLVRKILSATPTPPYPPKTPTIMRIWTLWLVISIKDIYITFYFHFCSTRYQLSSDPMSFCKPSPSLGLGEGHALAGGRGGNKKNCKSSVVCVSIGWQGYQNRKKKNRQASKSSTGWIRRLFFSISIFLLLFLFSIKALARKVGAN